MDEVAQASQEMGKAIYEKVAAEQAAAGAAGEGPGAAGAPGAGEGADKKGGGKVVDADFEVVDEDK